MKNLERCLIKTLSNNKLQAKVYVVPVVLIVFLWIILFLPAGTTKFWEAWIFWSGFSIITLFIAVYFTKKNPEFLSRRTKVKEEKANKKVSLF